MLAKTEESTAAKGSDVTKAISKTKFQRLLKNKRVRQGEMDEIRGAMGSEIANAVEKDSLDKLAFGIVSRLAKMEPSKLAYHLPNIMLYMEHAELQKIAESAPPLPMGGEGEAGEDEE
jgi:hypothetical protein